MWITREELAADVHFPFPLDPRRAPLSRVLKCRFLPASDSTVGYFHIVAEGAGLPGREGPIAHPDLVLIADTHSAGFHELAENLAHYCGVEVLEAESPPSSKDKFLIALDALEGLASADEIVLEAGGMDASDRRGETFTLLADALDHDERVTWAWIGDSRFAAGGCVPTPASDRETRIRELTGLRTSLRSDAGTRQLVAAVAGTSLAALSTMRLAQLWEIVAPPAPAPQTTPRTPSAGTSTSSLHAPSTPNAQPRSPEPKIPEVPGPEAPTRTLVGPARPESSNPRPAPVAAPAHTVQAPRGSAAVGSRWRVYFDCEGFRTIAVCDPRTGETKITKGELQGRRFTDPTSAITAVIERHDSNSVDNPDGWKLWLLHDGSGRSIGSMKQSGVEADRGEVEDIAPPSAPPRSQPASQPGVADQGIDWFLLQLRARGAHGERVMTSRRTAVRVERPGAAPIVVRVKTRTAGTWQAQKADEDLSNDDTGSSFWAFVDLSTSRKPVYILASEEVANGIRTATDAWIARDSRRERTGHHAIELARVAGGRDRWDLLGLFR